MFYYRKSLLFVLEELDIIVFVTGSQSSKPILFVLEELDINVLLQVVITVCPGRA
jgi:hypothetical protein